VTQKQFTSFGMKKYIVLKRKKKIYIPPHLQSLRDDSVLNYNLCLQLEVPLATELGGQRRQAFAQGRNMPTVTLGCIIQGAKGRGCCHATWFNV